MYEHYEYAIKSIKKYKNKISEVNVAAASQSGVTVFVAGSAVYKDEDISMAVEKIRREAHNGISRD